MDRNIFTDEDIRRAAAALAERGDGAMVQKTWFATGGNADAQLRSHDEITIRSEGFAALTEALATRRDLPQAYAAAFEVWQQHGAALVVQARADGAAEGRKVAFGEAGELIRAAQSVQQQDESAADWKSIAERAQASVKRAYKVLDSFDAHEHNHAAADGPDSDCPRCVLDEFHNALDGSS